VDLRNLSLKTAEEKAKKPQNATLSASGKEVTVGLQEN